ncbi:hypothetical protein TH63_18650 [Rufibacter radiotolerans]|uniref:histidine kinase n=1 Tax=Rufibacter radiotolerans TaxID=1379910 RepID=A0A0H4VPH6_9BACT|nr:ATP-binding protein [Rufibacter radiotolerans]AKQ47203.1 hypothetical protein TH63_18650 [Rufibacter radiotolerans]
MLKSPSDIIPIILIGTAILLVLALFIVSFLFTYQKKQMLYLREKEQLRVNYEKAISESQLEVQEETLKYVGRELHDNIGQILSLIKMNLHDPANPDRVTVAKDLIGGAIQDVRSLSKNLNNDWADDIGLPQLIMLELEKIQRGGLIQTELFYDGFPCPLDSKKKLIVFRVFQESLNNILKHARATEITVQLHEKEPAESFYLEIADNGVGFDLQNAQLGSGLTNIRKRMEAIQGQVAVKSRVGSGTRTEIELSYHSATASAN